MVGARQVHRRESIEADLAVGFRVLDDFALAGLFQRLMIQRGITPGEWQLAEEDILVDKRKRGTPECPQLDERRPEVSATVQLLVDPRRPDAVFVVAELGRGTVS